MSKAEETRRYIIEKAAPIFNKKGYAGTSLSDLIEATGLTKGALYGNFENKDEIASAVFEYSVSGLNKRVADLLQVKTHPYDKLIAFTDFYRLNWKLIFERGGCVVQNASVEADDNLAFLKKNVQHSIRGWIVNLSRIIETGKREGLFRKNADATHYAYTFITLVEGGIMLGKIMNNHQLLFDALDRIKLIIDTELLIKNKK